jgi:hypothetical protein
MNLLLQQILNLEQDKQMTMMEKPQITKGEDKL